MRLKLEFGALLLGTIAIYADGVRSLVYWLT